VAKGGNLVIIPSQEVNVEALNRFLATFGALQAKEYAVADKKVTKINFNHPLFSTVFEKKIDNFQYPNVKGSFTLSNTTPSILSFADQSPFLTAITNDLSSVYVFAAPLLKPTATSNSPSIVPTFYNMAQSAQKSGVNALVIAADQPFVVDAQLSKDEILTVKNTTESFIPVQQLLNTKVKMSFNENPATAGNYGVYNGQNLIQNISFNYNRTESNLDSANPELPPNINR